MDAFFFKRSGLARSRSRGVGAALVFAGLLMVDIAQAQIGTPGNAPMTPGGPRQGLGPPSITDHVPDMRLRAPGNGIPGAGPPIGGGVAGQAVPSSRALTVPIYRNDGQTLGRRQGVRRKRPR